MSWIEQVLDRLTAAASWRYLARGGSATEPAALTALALSAHGRPREARAACQWLIQLQRQNGSIGISPAESTPCWPTSLAVLAWQTADRLGADESDRPIDFHGPIEAAIVWILNTRGAVLERTPEMGHDSTLVGWPWVAGTHSWIEPTALGLLALKATSHGDHARAREAVRLLVDRMLPSGGCNYGNTFVLGQMLLAHVEPTGISLAALGGETDSGGRIQKAIAYLQRELSGSTATASLCYGLIGLAAHEARPQEADRFLETAADRALAEGETEYKLALLALAATGSRCPLFQPTTKVAPDSIGSFMHAAAANAADHT